MLEKFNPINYQPVFDKNKGAGTGAQGETGDPANITDGEKMKDLLSRAQSGDQEALLAIMNSNSRMFGFEGRVDGTTSTFSEGEFVKEKK